VIVEASPHDTIWGIGMHATDPDAYMPGRWKGSNMLGIALMTVRARVLYEREELCAAGPDENQPYVF
jgi:predicted NAD-dependent protein-ADP-ribosyltransferase YbiA (DUF1768 family)